MGPLRFRLEIHQLPAEEVGSFGSGLVTHLKVVFDEVGDQLVDNLCGHFRVGILVADGKQARAGHGIDIEIGFELFKNGRTFKRSLIQWSGHFTAYLIGLNQRVIAELGGIG